MNAPEPQPLTPSAAPALMQAAALLSLALPLLLPFSTVPDAVLVHQLAAVAAWGLWLLLSAAGPSPIGSSPGLTLTFLTGLLAAIAWQAQQAAQAGVLVAAALVLWATARQAAAAPGAARELARPMARAWTAAGLGCVLVAGVQMLSPEGGLGGLVSPGTTPGRAVGNMRQPNHLATALICAMVWTVWWMAEVWRAAHGPRAPRQRAQVLLLFAISLAALLAALAGSGSRTGAISLALLLAWALIDRRLPGPMRLLLGLGPLLYGGLALALSAWARARQSGFVAADRFQFDGDISSSRFAIWRNALELLAAHPWTGVGWGRFNLAWTFSPFPDRPTAFFDHSHNLPLQLAVEIGLPATLLLLLAWLALMWQRRAAWRGSPVVPGPVDRAGLDPDQPGRAVADPDQPGRAVADLDPPGRAVPDPDHPGRAVLVMLAVLIVHSQLEYPLWYAYFLLPAAWATGLWLGAGAAAARPVVGGTAPPQAPWLQGLQRLAGVLLMLGAVMAAMDHRRVERVFAPADSRQPLDERIARGQLSPLFGHHADYAAATLAPEQVPLAVFGRPLDHLIDVRLMVAYARALHARGHGPEALAVVRRLKEFRRVESMRALPDCRSPRSAGASLDPQRLGAWACAADTAEDLDWMRLRALAR